MPSNPSTRLADVIAVSPVGPRSADARPLAKALRFLCLDLGAVLAAGLSLLAVGFGLGTSVAIASHFHPVQAGAAPAPPAVHPRLRQR